MRADLGDAVVHVRDVAQARDAAAGQRRSACRRAARAVLRAAEHANRLLAATDLRAAAGRIEIERAQLLVDVDRGDAERLHARRIELDADLAVDAAAARHLRDARRCDSSRLVIVLSTNQDSSSSVMPVVLTRVVDDRAAFDVDALDRPAPRCLPAARCAPWRRRRARPSTARSTGVPIWNSMNDARLAFDRDGGDAL